MDKLESYWHKRFEKSAKEKEPHLMSILTYEGYIERKRIFRKILSKYKKDSFKTILDIGCGAGNYFDIYTAEGLKIHGLDFSKEQLEEARKRFPDAQLYHSQIEDFKANIKFGMVVSIGVIQTVGDFDSFLKSIQHNLSETGIAIITFLNANTIISKMFGDKNLKYYSLSQAKHHLKKYFFIEEYRRIYPMIKVLKVFKYFLYPLQIPMLNHAFIFVLRKLT